MKIDAPDSPAPDICRPDEETVEPRRQYVTETTAPVGAVTLDSSHQNEGHREDDRQRTAKSAATTLEILGDLPDMDAKPPENVLFVQVKPGDGRGGFGAHFFAVWRGRLRKHCSRLQNRGQPVLRFCRVCRKKRRRGGIL